MDDLDNLPSSVFQTEGKILEYVKSSASRFTTLLQENDVVQPFLSKLLFIRQHKDQIFRDNPLSLLDVMKNQGSRQVCQYQFKKNDIVWICKNCQKDETCVLCNDCYMKSTHEGHDVYFYHSQAGGCCDCGDPDAWEPKGFCTRHGHALSDPLTAIPQDLRSIGETLVDTLIKDIVDYVMQLHSHFEISKFLGGEDTADDSADREKKYCVILQNDDMHNIQDFMILLVSMPPSGDPSEDVDSLQAENKALLQKIQTDGYAIIRTCTLKQVRELAQFLSNKGHRVAILLKSETNKEGLIQQAVSWLYRLAQTNDGMCRLVCNALTVDRLRQLMECDGFMNKSLATALHGLYLTLMADQSFKMSVAVAYAQAYRLFAKLFGSGIGMNETAIFGLSVQFLNRASFVAAMVGQHGFLSSISDSLVEMLSIPGESVSHPILMYRRYNPLLGDLKVVFGTAGTARRFCGSGLGTWLDVLKKFQYLHPQMRSVGAHVEYETREWIHAFNLYLGLGSVFDYLYNWFGTSHATEKMAVLDESDILNPETALATAESLSDSLKKIEIPSVSDVLNKLLGAVHKWQLTFMESISWSLFSGLPFGHINLYPMPDYFSFHLFLHRFFSAAIRECCKYESLTKALFDIRKEFMAQRRHNILMTDIPLLDLYWGSAIKIGMWKRNGQMMGDQLLNYSEVPFCRIFRDLDLLLVQFCGEVYGTNALMNHILHRFGLFELFSTRSLRGMSRDKSFVGMLCEEMLLLLINLVTELPLPPLVPSERTKIILRREVIHSLVGGPSQYSKLQDCMALVPDHDKISSHALDEIIDLVAEQKEGGGMEPTKLVIKDKVWKEYDPAFMHVPPGTHQQAYELRPKLKSPQPIAPPPPAAHKAFLPFRSLLLADPLLLSCIRDLIYAYVSTRPRLTSYEQVRSVWELTCGGSEYARVLQLLTLVLHDVFTPDSLEEDNHVSMDDLGSPLASERRARLSEFLLEEPIVVVETVDENDVTEDHSQTLPSLLTALLDLHESFSSSEESNNKYWIRWVIDRCKMLSEDCEKVVSSRLQTQIDAQRAQEMEAKKKRARERAQQALQSVKISADAFAAQLGDTGDFDDDDGVGRDGLQAMGKDSAGSDYENATCIVCHAASSDDIGFIGFSQASRILWSRERQLHKEPPYPADVLERSTCETADLHLQFCGHAMHLKCFDTFFATVVQKSEQQNNLILDTSRGQFQCPLCKRLGNFIAPIRTKRRKKEHLSDESKANESAESVVGSRLVVDFERWLQDPRLQVEVMSMDGMMAAGGTVARDNGSHKMELEELLDASESKAEGPIGSRTSRSFTGILKRMFSSRREFRDDEGNIGGEVKGDGQGSSDKALDTDPMDVDNEADDFKMSDLSQEKCSRFLSDLCEPKFGFSVAPKDFLIGSNHSLRLAINAAAAVAFTITSEMCDLAPGHHVLATDTQDEQRYLGLVAEVLGISIFKQGLDRVLGTHLVHTIKGLQPPESLSSLYNDSIIGSQNLADGEIRRSLFNSVLEAHIANRLVLGLVLIRGESSHRGSNSSPSPERNREFEAKNDEILLSFVRVMCLASLTQLACAEAVEFVDSKMNDTTYGSESSRLADGIAFETTKEGGQLSPLLTRFIELFVNFVAGRMFEKYNSVSITSHADKEWMIRRISSRWSKFLAVAIQILLRCHPRPLPSFTSSPTNLEDQLKTLLLDWICGLNSEQLPNHNVGFYRLPNVVTLCVIRWTEAFKMDHLLSEATISDATLLEWKKICECVGRCTPPLQAPQFIELPSAYTELHGRMQSLCGYDYPALCLVCGAVLDGGGKGECTKHVTYCGGDSGVFFLLQDCMVLICHGVRAAYFPAPFVDEHGEKHRHFRGKPLHLDLKRYEVLRKLWTNHGVPKETISKRSSSTKVIINSHY